MRAATPIIIVTKGRHEMLAMTLASLYTVLSTTRSRYDIYHVWQDLDSFGEQVSPYDRLNGSYACRMAKAAVTSMGGVSWTDLWMDGSVGACRAAAINMALADADHRQRPRPENVLMFDGDVVFHGNPLAEAVKDNKGVTGWTHLDVTDERGFADFSHRIMCDVNDYLDEFGDLPHCEHPSPFHMYSRDQEMHHVSTAAAWRVDALTAKGADGQSVLDVWGNWPRGVRCYDVEGCRRIAELGYPIKILSCANYDLNMHLLADAVEGDWTSDAVHPTKVV